VVQRPSHDGDSGSVCKQDIDERQLLGGDIARGRPNRWLFGYLRTV
jgi:hypothetical protein